MEASSAESALSGRGAVICQTPSIFLTEVASPASDLTVISSIVSLLRAGNTFSLAVSAVPSGSFDVTK